MEGAARDPPVTDDQAPASCNAAAPATTPVAERASEYEVEIIIESSPEGSTCTASTTVMDSPRTQNASDPCSEPIQNVTPVVGEGPERDDRVSKVRRIIASFARVFYCASVVQRALQCVGDIVFCDELPIPLPENTIFALPPKSKNMRTHGQTFSVREDPLQLTRTTEYAYSKKFAGEESVKVSYCVGSLLCENANCDSLLSRQGVKNKHYWSGPLVCVKELSDFDAEGAKTGLKCNACLAPGTLVHKCDYNMVQFFSSSTDMRLTITGPLPHSHSLAEITSTNRRAVQELVDSEGIDLVENGMTTQAALQRVSANQLKKGMLLVILCCTLPVMC